MVSLNLSTDASRGSLGETKKHPKTYLSVCKIKHLPDPVDAVNLSVVQEEDRLAR